MGTETAGALTFAAIMSPFVLPLPMAFVLRHHQRETGGFAAGYGLGFLVFIVALGATINVIERLPAGAGPFVMVVGLLAPLIAPVIVHWRLHRRTTGPRTASDRKTR